MLTSLRHHLGLVHAFGLPAAVSIGFRRRFRVRKAVKVRWGRDQLLVRPHESDPNVASAVLGRTEYALGAAAEGALARLATRWRAKGATPIIIDGGANVGYAAVYFARTFPEATVIAIEPNAETFGILEKNCAGHANIKTVFGALWSHGDGVSLRSTPERSWADNVEEFAHSPSGGDLTPSYKLQDLLRLVPGAMPLIIKLDIEGAEHEVCRASRDLLRRTACLLVEPHDRIRPGSSCLSPLYDALKGLEVDTLLVGEYIAFIASSLVREEAKAPPSRLKLPIAIASFAALFIPELTAPTDDSKRAPAAYSQAAFAT